MTTPEEKKDALRALTKSKGWEILCELAARQVAQRTNQVMYTPLGQGWTLEAQEFTKGEAAGMGILLRLPEAMVEAGFEDEQPVEESD